MFAHDDKNQNGRKHQNGRKEEHQNGHREEHQNGRKEHHQNGHKEGSRKNGKKNENGKHKENGYVKKPKLIDPTRFQEGDEVDLNLNTGEWVYTQHPDNKKESKKDKLLNGTKNGTRKILHYLAKETTETLQATVVKTADVCHGTAHILETSLDSIKEITRDSAEAIKDAVKPIEVQRKKSKKALTESLNTGKEIVEESVGIVKEVVETVGDLTTMIEMQRKIKNLMTTYDREINELKAARGCFPFFTDYTINTKIQKRAALKVLTELTDPQALSNAADKYKNVSRINLSWDKRRYMMNLLDEITTRIPVVANTAKLKK